MFRRILVIAALAAIVVADATAAFAQSTRRSRQRQGPAFGQNHKFEIIGVGGYVWTFSRRVTFPQPLGTGDVDIKDSEALMLEEQIVVQVRLIKDGEELCHVLSSEKVRSAIGGRALVDVPEGCVDCMAPL